MGARQVEHHHCVGRTPIDLALALGIFVPLPNPPQITQTDFLITNIVPGDFNYDGKLDLLVMGQKSFSQNSEIFLRLYTGNGNNSIDATPLDLPSARTALPMIADLNGDMKTDLLGYAYEGSGTELSVWWNQADPLLNSTDLFNVTVADSIIDPQDVGTCVWSDPHSNAFVDLDGDCLADLFFTCADGTYQMWINQKQMGFRKQVQGTLPPGAGAVTFTDLDGDGTMDMLIPVCTSSGCQIHMLYNQQVPLCSKTEQPRLNASEPITCRASMDLCVGDPDFSFAQGDAYVILYLRNVMSSGLLLSDDNFQGHLPVPIRVGDYNLDGYPDLLVVGTDGSTSLLASIPCTTGRCSAGAVRAKRRTYQQVTLGAGALSNIQDARQAAWFDLGEDGTSDILVLRSGHSNNAARVPQFIHNGYFNDAFFLKGLVSNGVCPGPCSVGPRYPSPKPYGVNYPGASFKFTVLDTSGNPHVHAVAQYPQSAYLPLLPPYSLIGLGRTNNYIEVLFAGTSRHQDQHYYLLEGVIPNSQLIFIPYQPPHVIDTATWRTELYVRPAEYIPWVLVVLLASAFVLAAVVLILHLLEKREDERERKQALHIINFDAL